MTSKRKFDESDGNNVEDDDIQSGTDSESEIEDSDDDKPTGELPKQSAGVKAVSKLYSSLVKPKQGDSTARKGTVSMHWISMLSCFSWQGITRLKLLKRPARCIQPSLFKHLLLKKFLRKLQRLLERVGLTYRYENLKDIVNYFDVLDASHLK